jgi:hypothetical protein
LKEALKTAAKAAGKAIIVACAEEVIRNFKK